MPNLPVKTNRVKYSRLGIWNRGLTSGFGNATIQSQGKWQAFAERRLRCGFAVQTRQIPYPCAKYLRAIRFCPAVAADRIPNALPGSIISGVMILRNFIRSDGGHDIRTFDRFPAVELVRISLISG